MTNLGDLIGELRAAQARATAAMEQAATARKEIEKAERQFRATTEGSRRPEVRAAPGRWAAARGHLDKTIGRLLTGGHAVDVYIDLLGGGAAGTARVGEPSTAGSTEAPETEGRVGRLRRLRRELVRGGDDVVDATHDTTDAIRNLVPRGHGPATPHTASPGVSPADQQAGGVADFATGLMAGGIVAAEVAAKVGRAMRRLKAKKEKHDEQNG